MMPPPTTVQAAGVPPQETAIGLRLPAPASCSSTTLCGCTSMGRRQTSSHPGS